MKTFEIDCFEVTESDGDGVRSHHIAYVSTEELAKELTGRNSGWRRYNKYKKLSVVFDTMEEFEANTKEALKKSALAKLSPAEKQALGFF